MRPLACALGAATVLLLGLPATASAFDTGPHADVTTDALRAEGFGGPATDAARVENWFVDLYSQADKVPFSGHSDWFTTIIGLGDIAGLLNAEHWSDAVINSSVHTHFDYATKSLTATPGVEHEWDRLRAAVYTLAREAAARNDPLELLAVLGISLHQLQDFYAHTNWVEPRGVDGYDGPGWSQLGQGSNPTWFDVPKTIRDGSRIYTGGVARGYRFHGGWKSDGNVDLRTAMAKDWPGRPLYAEAYETSYFAARQWVRAVRSWVGDDAFWRRAQAYAKYLPALRHDVRGSFETSLYAGRWQGQGGPCTPTCGDTSGWGGSLLSLRSAVKRYFETYRGRSPFRRMYERTIVRLRPPVPATPDDQPPPEDPITVPLDQMPVPPSRDIQANTRFVRLQVLNMRGIDLGDPGPDDADMYARATIAGQNFDSAVIHSHDRFSFPRPYYPFTWIKAIDPGQLRSEPVGSMTIEVRTGKKTGAGTDDDVSLRLGPGLSFPLDKRAYDDFERGDRDTYSVPIDGAARRGLTLADIRYVEIAKSRDGIAGAWRLGGIKLTVNGRVLYANDRIERWLEGGKRTWRAPDFTPSDSLGQAIPVWLDLREDDDLYGSDDQGDVNPYDARDALARGYVPGDAVEEQITGGHKLGGRLGIGGDKATLRYRIETITPVLAEPPKPPEQPQQPGQPPPEKPDLVVSEFDLDHFTVKNQGKGAAGAFQATVTGDTTYSFSGLAPGASATQSLHLMCGGSYTVHADSGGAVDETDETNNDRSIETFC